MSTKIKASEVRKGDAIWHSMAWWNVEFAQNTRDGMDTYLMLVNRSCPSVAMQRRYRPNETVTVSEQ